VFKTDYISPVIYCTGFFKSYNHLKTLHKYIYKLNLTWKVNCHMCYSFKYRLHHLRQGCSFLEKGFIHYLGYYVILPHQFVTIHPVYSFQIFSVHSTFAVGLVQFSQVQIHTAPTLPHSCSTP